VPRVVLHLHQRDELPYAEIARRLAIEPPVVMACVAEALGMLVAMLDGDRPRRWKARQLRATERRLRQRHRHYCEEFARGVSIVEPIRWDKRRDDAVTVSALMLKSLPEPLRQPAFAFFRDRLSIDQIASRLEITRGTVVNRLAEVLGKFEDGPESFEDWLRMLGKKCPTPPLHGLSTSSADTRL
jgi:DNA-directed RNA polymerase specialized sigma24 family protein